VDLRHLIFQTIVILCGVFFPLQAQLLAAGESDTLGASYRSEKVLIPAADGLFLKGEVLVPETEREGASEGTFPAIVFLNPFGQGYGVYLNVARGYAERGFLVLLFNPRGWHGSQGHTTFDYRLLVQDNKAVIDWLMTHYSVNSGQIGLTGISEGGGLALLSAAHDSRIGAIASFSAWSDLLHPSLGDTTRTTWTGILGGLSLLFGEFGKMLENAREEQRNDPDGERQRQRAREISPIHHVEALNKNRTAIFLSHNFDDILFPVNEILELYDGLEGPKSLFVNPGFHAISEVMDLRKNRDGLWERAYGWFDQWLKHPEERASPIASQGITFALKNELNAVQVPNRSAPEITPSVYRIKSGLDGQRMLEDLTVNEVSSETTVESSPMVLKSARWHGGAVHTGIPLYSAYRGGQDRQPVSVNIRRFKEPFTLAFLGEISEADQVIYGVPRVKVSFHSQADKGQLIPHLLDVASDGTARLVTHGVWSWYRPSADGFFEQEIQLYGVAWRLAKGHRLMLAFDTKDLEYWPPQLGSYDLDFAKGRVSTTLHLPVLREPQEWLQ
jgi:predicted acyl esterase